MIDQTPNVGTNHDGSQEGEPEGLDIEQLREILGFVLRSARRRPKLALVTFAVVAALGVTVAVTMPLTYNSQVSLLAQRGSAIRVLTSSNPGAMDSVDNPTKNVATMIMRRDNLVSLAKEADLVQRVKESRPRALRLKDQVFSLLFGPTSAEDMESNLVRTLEKKLEVTTDDATSTVVISVDWSNPRIAYDLVTLIEKNFLGARYDSDVAVINESINVLEEHAKTELDHVDAELDAYQKLVASRAVKAPPARFAARIYVPGSPSAPAVDLPDPDLARALEEKKIAIRNLETGRQHMLDGLQQQLAQAQLTLTPLHPTVIALEQQVEALTRPSPELTQLRSEEKALLGQIVAPRAAAPRTPPPLGALSGAAPRPTVTADAGASAVDSVDTLPTFNPDRDGPLQLAESKLAAAIRGYQDATSRVDAARVELDITRAAYKYRYTVVTPAELTNKPKKATAQLVGAGSLVGAALLAILLASAADLFTGKILESWQVRRRLKLEVLAEFDRSL
jgi:uncharacterized protein involved in exopolysaccharide biosynthesis